MRKKHRRTGLWIVLFLLGIFCVAFVTVQKKEQQGADKGEETIVGCRIEVIGFCRHLIL